MKTNLRTLFILGLVLGSSLSFAGVKIISDFDDTIKRSNIVNGGLRTIYTAALYKKSFIGMPELLQEMNTTADGVYILSASPTILRPIIRKTLTYYEIPHLEIFTRKLKDIGTEEKKMNYKISKIESVLNKGTDDELILLGDNVEVDHKIYLEVAKRNPGKVSEIYIRKSYKMKMFHMVSLVFIVLTMLLQRNIAKAV